MAKLPKIWDFGDPLGYRDYSPKRGDSLSRTDMYHHAKFHADRCHRRRYICDWTLNTRSSAVAKRPRDASCLYSFYILEWCGYPMVKKIRTYVYSFWHDPRTWKNRRFHVQQPTFLFLLETPLRLSCNMLHGSKDNSMLAKQLAVCTYLQ